MPKINAPHNWMAMKRSGIAVRCSDANAYSKSTYLYIILYLTSLQKKPFLN